MKVRIARFDVFMPRRTLWLAGVLAMLGGQPVFAQGASPNGETPDVMGPVPWASLGSAQGFQMIQQVMGMIMQMAQGGGGGGGGGGSGGSYDAQSMINQANAYNAAQNTVSNDSSSLLGSSADGAGTSTTYTQTTSTYTAGTVTSGGGGSYSSGQTNGSTSTALLGSNSGSGGSVGSGDNLTIGNLGITLNTGTSSSGSKSSGSSSSGGSTFRSSYSGGGGGGVSIGGLSGGGGGSSKGGISKGGGDTFYSAGKNTYQSKGSGGLSTDKDAGNGGISFATHHGMRIGGGDAGSGRYLGGEQFAAADVSTSYGVSDPSATDPCASKDPSSTTAGVGKASGAAKSLDIVCDPKVAKDPSASKLQPKQMLAAGDSKDARKSRYKRGYEDAMKGVEPATDEPYYSRGYDDAMNHKQVAVAK